MQKPMTLDEVLACHEPMWIEKRDFAVLADENHWVIVWRMLGSTTFFLAMFGISGTETQFAQKYGADWRCWRAKPTEAERRAAEWGTPA